MIAGPEEIYEPDLEMLLDMLSDMDSMEVSMKIKGAFEQCSKQVEQRKGREESRKSRFLEEALLTVTVTIPNSSWKLCSFQN